MIFMTIPALLILKCLDDDDKGICRSFFPPMYGIKDCANAEASEYKLTQSKFVELKNDYQNFRNKSKNAYDFFNLVERSVLDMDDDDPKQKITDSEFKENGIKKEEM